MKLTHFLPYLFAVLVMFGCDDNHNDSDNDAANNQEAMANNEATYDNEEVDQDELWDTDKTEDFVKEHAVTHLRIMEITKAGQNAGFGDEINALTSNAMQSSQSAYNSLVQMAGGMNIEVMDKLTQDEISDMDLDEFNEGEMDDRGEDYLEALIKEYKSLVDDYEDAAEKGATAPIREHAKNLLQGLEADLMKIEAMEEEID
ncbi:MAG: hypothetical protein WBG62_18630 [Cyclobacteriaceae bacterium]